jgi:hypothetical protein
MVPMRRDAAPRKVIHSAHFAVITFFERLNRTSAEPRTRPKFPL